MSPSVSKRARISFKRGANGIVLAESGLTSVRNNPLFSPVEMRWSVLLTVITPFCIILNIGGDLYLELHQGKPFLYRCFKGHVFVFATGFSVLAFFGGVGVYF